MKKKFRAGLSLALALSLALTLTLSGCQSDKPAAAAETGAFSPVSSVDAAGERQSRALTQAEFVDFTWKPVVYSDYQRQGRPPEAEKFYRDCIEAMMKGETTVPCAKEELSWDMKPILRDSFPVMTAIVSSLEYRDGAVHITYSLSDAEREKTIEEFGRKIEEHIEKAVCEGDTPTMAAIALYHSFVGGLNYDSEATEHEQEDLYQDVTPYRALMTGEGICQSFGSAYAYLCMQLGINAVEASALDIRAESAHSWTMLELNGHHYFADPTYERGAGGAGLGYFGLNSERRARDGYRLEDTTLGFNLMDADEFKMTDDSFAPLWEMYKIDEICRSAEGMELRGQSSFSEQRSIPIEDGRRLLVTPCGPGGEPVEAVKSPGTE